MFDQRFGNVADRRFCLLCKDTGDGDGNIQGRLLAINRDSWIHVNCILWVPDIQEHKVNILGSYYNKLNFGVK